MAYGVSVVADVGPQVDNVGDDLRGYAWKYDSGERRREAHAMRAFVVFPAVGRVDLREVVVAGGASKPLTAVSFGQRHIDRRAGAQEDRDNVRSCSAEAGQTPQERRIDVVDVFTVLCVDGGARLK